MGISIKIFNTLSGEIETINTIESDHFRFYVCGPTVYDRPHLGNARSAVVYDLLFRLSQITFSKTTFVRNITDVDDKINSAAKEQGKTINEITTIATKWFHGNMKAINNLNPSIEPKATDHIEEIIVMIEKLIANGFAYVKEGNVMFRVESFHNYGALSGRNISEMIAGARIEIATYKENPLDFVLWKPASNKDSESSAFNSPWGKGRPGWHIECSAMSCKYLGVDFDLHGGGADLQFPHHENEIAQSCAANYGSKFAKYWMHNGFLTVNGEKMSKSLKNFITVDNLLDKEIDGIVIRFFLLSVHYRKPLDFNENAIYQSLRVIKKFYSSLKGFDFNFLNNFNNFSLKKEFFFENLPDNFLENISNDFNIANIIAILHVLSDDIAKSQVPIQKDRVQMQMLASLDFLGLFSNDFYNKILKENNGSEQNIDKNYDNELIELKIKQRNLAKLEKNWQLSDSIRVELAEIGVVVFDTKNENGDFVTKWEIKK